MGFAVVLWGAGGWRIDAWFGLAAAFALIAMSDAIYVAAQLGGGWTPGTSNDLGYAAGSLLIALAAWGSRRTVGEASPTARVALPIVFTVTAFPARRLRGVHPAGPGRRGDDPPHPARRRGPARPHAVVAVAPARRPRGARRLRPADRAGQLPRVPGAPAARGGRGGDGQPDRARPRPLQDAQRHVRPCRGRPRPAGHRHHALAHGGGGGLRRARRRRGVRDRAVRRRRGGRGGGRRALPRRARLARVGTACRWRARRASPPTRPTPAASRSCSQPPTARCTGPSARAATACARFDPRHVVALSLARAAPRARGGARARRAPSRRSSSR